MHPWKHTAITTAAAAIIGRRRRRFPWLFWAAGVLADVDHVGWYAGQTGRVAPLATWRYFLQDPEIAPIGRLPLHHPALIAACFLASRRWRPVWELAAGLALHRLLDDGARAWRSGQRAWRIRRRARLQAIVFSRERYTCQCCGAVSVTLELHHRIPESAGGRSHPHNLLALCRPCHDRAHGRPERPR